MTPVEGLQVDIMPAQLEDWLRDYYFTNEIDISSSGVESFSLADIRALTGLSIETLDAIVFRDSPSYGQMRLRKAIAQRWGNDDPEHVMATNGSSEAIFLVMNALLRAGDEVVVLDPAYHALGSIAKALGCRLVPWHLSEEEGFSPDLTLLSKLLTSHTRMVIVNFPHNPTGASLTTRQQEDLLHAVENVGAYLVWDAAFAEIVYEHSPLPDPTRHYGRAISFGTLSKAYGLSGLRVGWCVAPPEVLKRCMHLRDYITLALSPLVEMIAAHVVEHGDLILERRLTQARLNLTIVALWMDRHAGFLDWTAPRGGVTVFPRLHTISDVDAFCHRLLREHSVLLVPGSCFGRPQHVRLGFGGSTASLQQGLARLSTALLSNGHRR